jgi:hypothetical protein
MFLLQAQLWTRRKLLEILTLLSISIQFLQPSFLVINLRFQLTLWMHLGTRFKEQAKEL